MGFSFQTMTTARRARGAGPEEEKVIMILEQFLAAAAIGSEDKAREVLLGCGLDQKGAYFRLVLDESVTHVSSPFCLGHGRNEIVWDMRMSVQGEGMNVSSRARVRELLTRLAFAGSWTCCRRQPRWLRQAAAFATRQR